jgi:hypothetical protein
MNNKLKTSYRFGRFPSITISEWDNGGFSASKAQLKDKNKGWKDKSNIERTNILSFFYNEIFLVRELLKMRSKKFTLGNFSFEVVKEESGADKIHICKSYVDRTGQTQQMNFKMSINEYYIIKALVDRIVEHDFETRDMDNNNFNTIPEPEDEKDFVAFTGEEEQLDDAIPF